MKSIDHMFEIIRFDWGWPVIESIPGRSADTYERSKLEKVSHERPAKPSGSSFRSEGNLTSTQKPYS